MQLTKFCSLASSQISSWRLRLPKYRRSELAAPLSTTEFHLAKVLWSVLPANFFFGSFWWRHWASSHCGIFGRGRWRASSRCGGSWRRCWDSISDDFLPAISISRRQASGSSVGRRMREEPMVGRYTAAAEYQKERGYDCKKSRFLTQLISTKQRHDPR